MPGVASGFQIQMIRQPLHDYRNFRPGNTMALIIIIDHKLALNRGIGQPQFQLIGLLEYRQQLAVNKVKCVNYGE
jgi:hypothetical protein